MAHVNLGFLRAPSFLGIPFVKSKTLFWAYALSCSPFETRIDPQPRTCNDLDEESGLTRPVRLRAYKFQDGRIAPCIGAPPAGNDIVRITGIQTVTYIDFSGLLLRIFLQY